MTTNSSALNFRNHDSADVRERVREFMANQDVLTDYDIDGSVLDLLISALADVTEKNTVSANVLFAENSITTAYNRKNIALKATDFGYTPYSINASKATIDITVVVTESETKPSILTLPKGSIFLGSGDSDELVFSTITSYTAELQNDRYVFEGVELYQGSYSSTDIYIDHNRRNRVYEIGIEHIDTSFLEVYVQKSIDSLDFTRWFLATSSISVDSESEIFYLRELDYDYYGIEFGDGTLGAEPNDKSIVRVVYFKTDGSAGNGISSFRFKSAPSGKLNTNTFSTIVSTVSKSSGGFSAESDESVRINAPKFYVSQNRAVIPQDYEDQLRQRFPYLNAVNVWSGQNRNQKYDQLGRIYIAANTNKSQYLTEAQKEDISDEIIYKIGLGGVIPVFVDVNNTYIQIKSTVYVDDFAYVKSSDIIELVEEYTNNYSTNTLNSFKGKFKLSPFSSGIDALSSAIKSNLTSVSLHKRVYPDVKVTTSFDFSFHNEITYVYSNSFTYGPTQVKVVIKSNSDGTLDVYDATSNSTVLIKTGIGTVDFKTGDISISDIYIYKTNATTKDIRFFATPAIQNIEPKNNNILTIDSIDVNIEKE